MVGTYGGGGSGVLGGVHMSAGARRSWVGARCRLRVEGRPWGVIVIRGGVSSSVCGHRRPRVGHSWWGIVVRVWASSSAGGAFVVGYRRPCMRGHDRPRVGQRLPCMGLVVVCRWWLVTCCGLSVIV